MFKEPITDTGKKSKKGRLTLEHENGEWITTQEGTGDPDKVEHLNTLLTCLLFLCRINSLLCTKMDR